MQIARWAVIASLLPSMARGQTLSGVVRDSASRRPLPGVVISLLDARGTTLVRTIAGESGSYRLTLATTATRLRAQRIGLRPTEISLGTPAASRLDVLLSPIPTMLDPVRAVASSRCAQRPDGGAAFALLEQARSGLLAILVGREANPATLKRLVFMRTLNDRDSIVHQSVTADTRAGQSSSFSAVRSPAQFVDAGFAGTAADGDAMFFGPDVETLLDDAFARGYCFRLAAPEAARPRQVGLRFTAATRKAGRIDLDGTLWIDTSARALRDIEFRYTGLGPRIEALKPGGRIEFREMPNGVVLIDRWTLRLVSGEIDTRYGLAGAALLDVRESGGEIARAAWPSGTPWQASLGTARFRVAKYDGSTPASGAIVRLFDTSYEGVADTTGIVEIRDLLPGPYAIVLSEPQYAKYGVRLETPIKFVAIRDSTHFATLTVPNINDVLAGQCAQSRRVGGTVKVLGRVETADGKPVSGAQWTASIEYGAGPRRPVGSGATAKIGDKTGVFELCSPILGEDDVMTFEARTKTASGRISHRLIYPVTLVTIRLDDRP